MNLAKNSLFELSKRLQNVLFSRNGNNQLTALCAIQKAHYAKRRRPDHMFLFEEEEETVDESPVPLSRYGKLNVRLWSYDLRTLEWMEHTARRTAMAWKVQISDRFSMPTKKIKIHTLKRGDHKVPRDIVLWKFEKIVQVDQMPAVVASHFAKMLQSQLPQGVTMTIEEHTEEVTRERLVNIPSVDKISPY